MPGFVAKTLNPSVPDTHFDEFTVPSLDDFVDRDRGELLLCLIRAVKKYLSKTEPYRPAFPNLFVSAG